MPSSQYLGHGCTVTFPDGHAIPAYMTSVNMDSGYAGCILQTSYEFKAMEYGYPGMSTVTGESGKEIVSNVGCSMVVDRSPPQEVVSVDKEKQSMNEVMEFGKNLLANEYVQRWYPVVLSVVFTYIGTRLKTYVFNTKPFSYRADSVLHAIQHDNWNWDHESAGPVNVRKIGKCNEIYIGEHSITDSLTRKERKAILVAWKTRKIWEEAQVRDQALETADAILGIG